MPSTERKYTPEENKARRFRAAQANVEAAAKKLEKAEAKVVEAKELEIKRDAAREALTLATEQRDWIKSMPVPGEAKTPAADEDTETSAPAEDETDTFPAE
jgi:Asp-tRNA(Asn)/Glu-tRNA(Gln) amidotransferase A subunit family amidase